LSIGFSIYFEIFSDFLFFSATRTTNSPPHAVRPSPTGTPGTPGTAAPTRRQDRGDGVQKSTLLYTLKNK
jgi:hypothetical protein